MLLVTLVKKTYFWRFLNPYPEKSGNQNSTIMTRSVFVPLLLLLMSFSVLAQTTKKVARPDIPGIFVFYFVFNRARIIPPNFSKGFRHSLHFTYYYQNQVFSS